MTVPHTVRYVFANFEEAVDVDCYCERGEDHLDVYPVYDEVFAPAIRRVTHSIRSWFRKDHQQ